MPQYKAVDEYEGKYVVSSDGFIYTKNGIRRGVLSKNGYLRIILFSNGKFKSWRIHRLVAKHFLPHYLESLQVNHINGIRTDNRVENLEMNTQSQNMLHSYKYLNRMATVTNGRMKLTIFIDEYDGLTQFEMGRKIFESVSRILNTRRYTQLKNRGNLKMVI